MKLNLVKECFAEGLLLNSINLDKYQCSTKIGKKLKQRKTCSNRPNK